MLNAALKNKFYAKILLMAFNGKSGAALGAPPGNLIPKVLVLAGLNTK